MATRVRSIEVGFVGYGNIVAMSSPKHLAATTAALVLLTVGLTACSSSTTGSGSPISPAAPTGTSSDATPGPTAADPTAADPTATGPTTAGPTGGATDGNEPKTTLQAKDLIDAQGRVRLAKLPDTDAAVSQAACSYLFGTPQQLASAAKTGALTQQSGPGATVLPGALACVYDAASTKELFVIAIGKTTAMASVESAGKDVVKVPAGSGLEAVLGYNPAYSGSTIATADGQALLTAAVQRADLTGL